LHNRSPLARDENPSRARNAPKENAGGAGNNHGGSAGQDRFGGCTTESETGNTMSRHLVAISRAFLFVGLLGLVGCDIDLNPDEAGPAELGEWRGKPIRQWILELKDEATKDRASRTLAQLGPDDREMVPTLIALLKDDDRIVRGGACRLLGQIGPKAKDALKPLDDLIIDPDKMVRQECLWARKRIRNLLA
jgi:hypothetical protein